MRQAQGFVAVTPMRWPGGGDGPPRTPGGQAGTGAGALQTGTALATGPATPLTRAVAGAGGGTYKK